MFEFIYSLFKKKITDEMLIENKDIKLEIGAENIKDYINLIDRLCNDNEFNINRKNYGIKQLTTIKLRSLYIDNEYLNFDKGRYYLKEINRVIKRLKKLQNSSDNIKVNNIYKNHYSILLKIKNTLNDIL